jgi:hypothetical protein
VAIFHLRVGDYVGGVEKNGIFRVNEAELSKLGFACQSADFQIAVLFPDVGKPEIRLMSIR